MSGLSSRPTRIGPRNTYHCCNKGKKNDEGGAICPGICPGFDIGPDGNLYCSWCLPKRWEKTADFCSLQDWIKLKEQTPLLEKKTPAEVSTHKHKMRQFRKVGRQWQFKVEDGEWQNDYVEPDINILQPDWDGKGFYWPDLELKVAGKKGLGVFVARDLPKGTAIPILGEKKEERYCTNRHNIGYYDRSRPGTGFRGCIDGDPTQYPYKDAGYFGLSIAMMLNEASKPTCVFRESNYVQLARKVKKGQELTVYLETALK